MVLTIKFPAIWLAMIWTGLLGSQIVAGQSREVIRDKVDPQWSTDGQRFWFLSSGPGGEKECILVDAKAGTRQPLFDPVELAALIEKETKRKIDAGKISKKVRYDIEADILTINLPGEGSVRFNRKTSTLDWTKDKKGDLFLPVKPSLESETAVKFTAKNDLQEPLEILWVNTENQIVPYATIEPGQSWSISTYATHVWLIRKKDGTDLGCFRIEDEEESVCTIGQAAIDSVNDESAWLPVELSLPVMGSGNSSEKIQFTLKSELKNEIEILWVDNQKKEKFYSRLAKGEIFSIQSFVGHVWLFREVATGKNLGVFRLPDESDARFVLNQVCLQNVKKNPAPNRKRQRKMKRLGDVPANRSHGSNSPDGKYSLFVKDHDLWVRGPNGKDEQRLTDDGNEQNSFRQSIQNARLVGMAYDARDFPADRADVAWSADSQYAIAWQTTVVSERRVILKRDLGDGKKEELGSYPYAKPGDDLPARTLRLFNLTAGKEIELKGAEFSDPWELSEERFSNDGRFVWVRYQQRGHQKMQIWRIELETGKAAVVIDETSSTFLHYSTGEKYRLSWLSDSTAIWSSERSGWNHLYHIDMTTGKVLNPVTQGDWNVRRIDRITKDQIWFYVVGIDPQQDPYFTHYCRVNLDGSNFCRLTDGDGMHSIEWSPTEEYLIDRFSRVDQPAIHDLRSAENGKRLIEVEHGEMVVSDAADSAPKTIEKFLSQPFSTVGRDGKTPIWGVVHFPEDFDERKSYPVIESIYAGPHDYHVPKEFSRQVPFDEFRKAGFVVVQIDGMGTAWRSKAFHDVCYRNLKDAGFPDRVAWIKALGKKFSNLDLNRVGIFGGSAGGQNAMGALLWHHDFYKVAVADCGCHDNRMDKVWWNEQWMGKVSPGDHYVANSNRENAYLLKGALMLVVGEVDRNVDPESTFQVADKLREAGKEFELLVVRDGGHGACESPENRKKRLEFFQKHLQR